MDYLETLTNYEQHHQPHAMRRITLDRMRLLCEQLGNPQHRFRSILVAGTNGKGSICAMIYEILRQAGLCVGLYTSPHLEDVRERIRVSEAIPARQEEWGAGGSNQESGIGAIREGTDWITKKEFAVSIDRVRSTIEQSTGTWLGGLPTYFEVLTSAAFLHFAQQHIDIGVLEVGLGGRLDATNIVEQAVSVIGPISLDHTDVLGHDLITVAREKAGILKPITRNGQRTTAPPRVVISAPQQPTVSVWFHRFARAKGFRLLECGKHLFVEVKRHRPSGMEIAVEGTRGRYDTLTLPLLGRHQAGNALAAIAAVEALTEGGVPYSAVQRGLTNVSWPGRLEVLQDRPLVLLDGAHNPQAIRALKDTLEELWPSRPTHLLLGLSADKDIAAIGNILSPMVSSVVCTRSRHPRASDPKRLAQRLTPYFSRILAIPDVADAYTYLLNSVSPEDVIVVTGSLFLVGELRTMVRNAQPHQRPVKRSRPAWSGKL